MKNLKNLKIRTLILSLIFLCCMNMITFAATWYSNPSSSAVTLAAGTLASSGWSSSASGPFSTATIATGDQIVIQAGSVVTTGTAGGQTVNSITFGTGTLGDVGSTLSGGTFILNASSFNCGGNIAGNGVYTNGTTNPSTRITMNGTGKTINANLTGSGGITIGTSTSTLSVSLAGNSIIGGRVSLPTTSGTITLNLAGFNLTCDNLAMSTTTKLTASGTESLTLTNTTPVSVSSQLYMDQTTPGTTNKLASLTVKLLASSTITNGLQIGTTAFSAPLIVNTLTITSGKILLNNSNLTVNNSIVGGDANAFIVTNTAAATATGALIYSVPAARTFIPCGTISSTSGSSFDNISVTPTSATTYTIQVKNAFTNAVADATKVTDREFTISSSVPSNTVLEITPNFPFTSPPSPVIGYYSSGVWTEVPATLTSGTYSANITASSTTFGVGTAGGFIAGTLPIKLISFDAVAKQKSVSLSWATSSEKDNALFKVEQSTNGLDFKTVGEITGAGTKESVSNYTFEDTNPSSGTSYYRLKQVDFNGTATFSDLKAVKFAGKDFALAYNLVQNNLQITLNTNTETSLAVYNMAGQRMIKTKAIGSANLDVSALKPGVYIISADNGSSANFIKQ